MLLHVICLICSVPSIICGNYYDLFGITKDADSRDIRKAFKKLALKFHPDKNKDEEKAQVFIEINKAYEILKDDEKRKQYDLYGEDGLKKDFGKHWRGNYHSWDYYSENFGIYDDDPEVVTLSRMDFVQLVRESQDFWFVNFYSPQCHHCHQLAPAWRKLARELKDVLQIGAVNCEEDRILCRQLNINSYPTLIMYPQGENYKGSREVDDMVQFALHILPSIAVKLTSSNFHEEVSRKELIEPWLLFSCKNEAGCVLGEDLRKIGLILEDLINVAEIDRKTDEGICKIVHCDSPVRYYFSLKSNSSEWKSIPLYDTDIGDIVKKLLPLLPTSEELTDETFKEMREKTKLLSSSPWLIHFTKSEPNASDEDIDLKRLSVFLPQVLHAHFNCEKYPSICSALYIQKFPTFVIFKPGDMYEFYHGKITAHSVAIFAREALSSQVQTLNPEHFPLVKESQDPWFIDFFAPWCPPCLQFLPEFRKASHFSGHLVKFGTVDCTVHSNLCRKYNINSYPTAILYNQSVPHMFAGSHSHQDIEEFVMDILNPLVVSLNPLSFENLVESKKNEDIWVIDFFVPWCGPCRDLAPQWRKLAKVLVQKDRSIHIGEVNCQIHDSMCSSMGVKSYPTIRLYPIGEGAKSFMHYSGWRDMSSLLLWIYDFRPSGVRSLTATGFEEVLFDSQPWVIDFYVPWCTPCRTFAPEFEQVAQVLKGRVKVGKINCEAMPKICKWANIAAYPTVLFYEGKKSSSRFQDPLGEEIHEITVTAILSFIEDKLNIKLQEQFLRDEL